MENTPIIKIENTPIIKIENLTKSFGDKQVLKGVNLEIFPGQVIGYIGQNGAGKSTTVKILLGLIDTYEGNVSIFGNNIKDDKISYKGRIGYVPESSDLYDTLTSREYLVFIGEMYGLDKTKVEKKAMALAKLFGIYENFDSRISSYSKGMRQKLLIIASIIHDPDILFLDEPISGLDANSVMIFKEIIATLAKRGKTIFYSSHIMEVVEKISDRILLLNDGVIVANGTFEELSRQNADGSLQDIFNALTGVDNHKEVASSIVDVIEDIYSDEQVENSNKNEGDTDEGI